MEVRDRREDIFVDDTNRHDFIKTLFGHVFSGRYKAIMIDAGSPGYTKPFDIVGRRTETVKITVNGEVVTKVQEPSAY